MRDFNWNTISQIILGYKVPNDVAESLLSANYRMEGTSQTQLAATQQSAKSSQCSLPGTDSIYNNPPKILAKELYKNMHPEFLPCFQRQQAPCGMILASN
jgi:hypothetical protein